MSSGSDDDIYDDDIGKRLKRMERNFEEKKRLEMPSQDDSVLVNKTNDTLDDSEDDLDELIRKNLPKSPVKRGRGRGRGRKKGNETKTRTSARKKQEKEDLPTPTTTKRTSLTQIDEDTPLDSFIDEPSSKRRRSNNSSTSRSSSSKGRGRQARRGARVNSRGSRGSNSSRASSARRGHPRGSSSSWTSLGTDSDDSNQIPIFSVGNTDEYPDQLENQSIFGAKNKTIDESVLEENELLSVKVCWQSTDIEQFQIRRFQKLAQIFTHYSKVAQVDIDKLLFMYDDRILKPDDSPESIDYNIGKFIDGGVLPEKLDIAQSSKKEDVIVDGITLKFQMENVKKPFETTVSKDDSLAKCFIKCAEYFEKPIEHLKFIFDGDYLSGKTKPSDIDLEGGECIDVKINIR